MSTPSGNDLTVTKMPFPELIVKAEFFLESFPSYQSRFVLIDSRFDFGFSAILQSAIDRARSTHEAALILENKMILTDEGNALLEQSRNAVQLLFYAVAQAMPGKDGRINAYGKSDYLQARQVRERMISLMEKAAYNFTEDAALLDSIGYDSSRRAAFTGLLGQLRDVHTQLSAVVRSGPDLTKEAKKAEKELWALLVRLNRAARFACADSPADRRRWRLYDHHAAKKRLYTLKIAAGQQSVMRRINKKPKPEKRLSFRMMAGDAGAKVYFLKSKTDGIDSTATPILLPAKGEISMTYGELGLEANFLRIETADENAVKIRVGIEL